MATTPTTTTTTPPSTPVIRVPVNYDNLNESWCELQYKSGCSSTGSISHLHHSVNPEILEKLLQEAQRESLLSHPPSPQPYLGALSPVKSTIYCEHHIESSTPILVDMDVNNSQLLMSNLTSPIKLIDSPISEKFHVNNHTSQSFKCSDCSRHQKQIDILLEKQIDQEKLLIDLRKEYEQKMLTKSPELMMSSQSSFSSSDNESDTNMSNDTKTTTRTHQLKQLNSTLKRQNSSTSTLVAATAVINDPTQTNINSSNNNQMNFGYSSSIYNYNKKSTTDPDWMKYWSSRIQTQPPKEWNFVHPNSAKSKLRKTMENSEEMLTSTNSKLLSKENIGKLIFTHMASFIVGATLMFLVLRRHLNIRSSIYFV